MLRDDAQLLNDITMWATMHALPSSMYYNGVPQNGISRKKKKKEEEEEEEGPSVRLWVSWWSGSTKAVMLTDCHH